MALNLLDITTNNNDLTNNNGVTEVTTNLPFVQSTSAADFERDSIQYLSITDAAQTGLDFAAATAFTIELWIKVESIGITNRIVNKSAGGGTAGYELQVLSVNDKVQFSISDGVANISVTSTNALSTGTWYHLVFRRDTGAADNIEILRATAGGSHSSEGTTADTTTGSLANAEPFEIGAANGGNTLDGITDDVRVWNTARSNAQLDANFEVELVGNESGLVAYWP